MLRALVKNQVRRPVGIVAQKKKHSRNSSQVSIRIERKRFRRLPMKPVLNEMDK